MNRFRTTLIHSRDIERTILKKELSNNTGHTHWDAIAHSRTVVDFRPPNDGNENKPKGYGNGYGYGIRSPIRKNNISTNNIDIYQSSNDIINDNYDNYHALESVANKLLQLGINIEDNTLLTLLEDNDNPVTNYNWKFLQERIHSYLGIKITNEEAQVLLTRLY